MLISIPKVYVFTVFIVVYYWTRCRKIYLNLAAGYYMIILHFETRCDKIYLNLFANNKSELASASAQNALLSLEDQWY